MTAPEPRHAPPPPPPWPEAYARLYREGRADFPPACLRYVENVVRQAASTPSPWSPPVSGQASGVLTHRDGPGPEGPEGTEAAAAGSLSPAMVVSAFRAMTQRDFGPLREDVLRQWGLLTPFDLGRAITLLGRVDRLLLDEGDDPIHYAMDTVPFTEERSS